jgi:Methane oxygenase PmoA
MITTCLVLCSLLSADPGAAPDIAFTARPDQLVITAGTQPLATYVYQDKEITRPFFAHVHAPGGTQITRNHPPIAGQDLVDHATFHPGIWLAFGDINGQDFWRLRARVRHDRFLQAPRAEGVFGTFTVQNSYCRADAPEEAVCQEICRYAISSGRVGYLLVSDSAFFSPTPFTFGDQEEMGLGVRVATPIAVKSGGHIVDAVGRADEKGVWGKSSAWCDYQGAVDGREIGIMIMSDPANFRPARFHARDYGLLAANPFGQKVFGDAEESRVTVAPGEVFRLRFGVLLHATRGKEFDRRAAYDAFLRGLARLPRPKPADSIDSVWSR